MTDTQKYADRKGKHAYDVEAESIRTGSRVTFNVHAVNRTQAAARVKQDGWFVRSVNMTG